jgi:hypothetical protein
LSALILHHPRPFLMDAEQDAFRDPQCNPRPPVSSFFRANRKNTWLILEERFDAVVREVPHLSDLVHGVVPLKGGPAWSTFYC